MTRRGRAAVSVKEASFQFHRLRQVIICHGYGECDGQCKGGFASSAGSGQDAGLPFR